MSRLFAVAMVACITAATAPAAFAQNCPCVGGNTLDRVQGGTELQNLLTGRTVCAQLGNDRWQERHVSGGALRDYKLGPNHPIDPTKQVGTWSTTGSGANTVVTYSYTGGRSHSFVVCRPGNGTVDPTQPISTVAFCGSGNSTNITNARLTAVNTVDVACP